MKKRFVLAIILLLTLTVSVFGMFACDESEEFDVKSVYNLYVAYAEEAGETPMTYQEWILTVKGDKGENGKSAYELAVESGYKGTFDEWIEYLDGRKFTFVFIRFDDAEYMYDGLAKSIYVSGVPNGATVIYEPTNTYTEVGEYEITATVSADGAEDITLTATMTIKYSEKYLLKAEIEELLFTLQREIEFANAENHARTEELTIAYGNTVQTLNNSITANQNAIEHLRAEYENDVMEIDYRAASDKQELLNKLNADKAALQNSINDLTAEYRAAVAELESAGDENAQAIEDLTDGFNEQVLEFTTVLEDLENDYNSKIIAVNTALNSAKTELQNALNAQVATLNTAIDNANTALATAKIELQNSLTALDGKYQTKVNEINTGIQNLQAVLNGYGDRITELENTVNILTQKTYYTVSFDSDGGTEVPEQSIADGKKAIKPAEPQKEGCVFKGWFVGDEQWNFLYCIVTENVELKAKWVEVSFENTAGDKSEIEIETENNEITLTANHKAGYTWLGWYSGDEKVSQGNSYSITFNQSESNRVYTAKFSKITVRQNVAGAGTITQLNGKYFYGSTATISATVKSGYVFKGWYKNSEKVSEDVELDYEVFFGTENETYTATYISNPVSVAKNIAAAGTVEKPSTGIIGGDYTITATTNSGYTWLGWYSGDEKVSVGDSLSFTFVLTETPITYTAKWVEYKVSLSKNYDKAGTTTGSGSKTVGDNVSVSATNDYSEYFTFDGWYNGSSKVSSSANYTFEMPNNNISLTAKWNLKSGVEAITTASQLNAIDGTKKYILLNDINLSGITFTSKEISASGVLDGLGYKIKNFACPKNSLISQNSGTVKNLVIDQITSCESSTDAPFVNINNGMIINCGVEKSTNRFNVYSGFCYNNRGTISECFSKLDIYGIGSGIAGSNSGTIERCYFNGSFNCYANGFQVSISFCGLSRNNSGIVNNCFAKYTYSYEFGMGSTGCQFTNKLCGNAGGSVKNSFIDTSGSNSRTALYYSSSGIENETNISNIESSTFIKNTIGFKEYGKGTISNGYVWVFENGSLPKLYWE